MKFKDLKIGDVLLVKKANANGHFLPDEDQEAVVTKIGKQFLYLKIRYSEIKCKLSDELPAKLDNSYYSLFRDEDQFTEFSSAREARNKLSRFFNYNAGASKLTDDQVEKINRIIGI